MTEAYDLVVIGGGMAGYVGAIRASQQGARVVLVERDALGGTCLNRGCIPTKALLHDAELFRAVAAPGSSVESDSPLRVSLAKMQARKRAVVAQLVGGVEQLLLARKVEVIRGQGRLLGRGRVAVATDQGERELAARHVLLATGSQAHVLRVEGADLPGVMTSDGALELQAVPESVVVVGGSTVGVEFACLFAALGARVTILEAVTFLPGVEPQLARRFRALLARRGMAVSVGAAVERFERAEGGALRACYQEGGQARCAEGQIVLLATGRVPVTQGLGLEEAGVALHGRAIAVDAHLRTHLPGVWAAGDCIGGHLLAHVATYEAELAVDNMLAPEGTPLRAVDYTVVPKCLYAIPEIASVGLTEGEAKAQGLEALVTRFPFSANGRALTLDDTEGQVRLVCQRQPDGTGGRVLGAHIMGPHASELIAEVALAMRLGATAADIAGTVHAHPTASEALMEAAMAQGPGAIHFLQR